MTVTPYLTIPLRTEEQARADRAKRRAAKQKTSATVIDLPVCEVDVMVGAGVNRI